jgi:hypothetical protein
MIRINRGLRNREIGTVTYSLTYVKGLDLAVFSRWSGNNRGAVEKPCSWQHAGKTGTGILFRGLSPQSLGSAKYHIIKGLAKYKMRAK